MDRFENMAIFNRVVEAGSISAAAESAGIAKSAVSRRLKELEAHLGVQLFQRTTRRINLTDTGRAFYQRSTRILEDVIEAEHATSQRHGTLKGRLKVALPSTFGYLHLGPAVSAFLTEHPGIEFELDFNERSVDLMQEGFDLAIRIAQLPDSSLIARRLAPVRHVMCASQAYLDEHGTPQSLEDLANHRCLVYSLSSEPDHWVFQTDNRETSKIKVTAYLKASSGEYLTQAAIDGLGIIQLPSFIVHRDIEQGRLVPVLSNHTRTDLHVYAIYPQTRHLSQRVRAFIDFLVKRFEDVPYWDQCLSCDL